jgi:hypothetical protein
MFPKIRISFLLKVDPENGSTSAENKILLNIDKISTRAKSANPRAILMFYLRWEIRLN